MVDQLAIVDDFMGNSETSVQCTISDEFNKLGTLAAQDIGNIGITINNEIRQKTGINYFLQLQDQLNGISTTSNEFLKSIDATSAAATVFLAQFDNFSNPIAQASRPQVDKEIADVSAYPDDVKLLLVDFIPRLVSDFNFSSAADVQKKIDDTTASVNAYTNEVTGQINSTNATVQSSVSSFISSTEELRQNIQDAQGNITDSLSNENLDKWSWTRYSLLVFIVPIAFILLCLAFGLLFGIVGYKPNVEPYERSTISSLGGACLMVAVVLTFIFAWILMLITMTFFGIGFLTETIVCKETFENRNNDMFTFIQNNWEKQINAGDFVVNISLLVNSCEQNDTLYIALNASQVLNLSDIQNSVKTISNGIDINKIMKFDQNSVYVVDRNQLGQLQGVLVNLSSTLSSNPPITNTSQTTEAMKQISANVTSQSDINEFNKLNNMFINLNTNIEKRSNSYIKLLGLLSKANLLVNDFTANYPNAIDPNIVIVEVNKTATESVKRAQDNLTQYTDTFISRVEYDTAKCNPLYQVYENVGDILCKQVMNPVQAIWLSLGWCLLFFIPLIVIAVKLEKYFRKMSGDSDDSHHHKHHKNSRSKLPRSDIPYGWDIPDRIPDRPMRAKPHQVEPV